MNRNGRSVGPRVEAKKEKKRISIQDSLKRPVRPRGSLHEWRIVQASCSSIGTHTYICTYIHIYTHTDTLYSASAVLRLYFAIRARCFTSALALCRMQEPFSRTLHPAPLHLPPLTPLPLFISPSPLLLSFSPLSPPYGRPRCSCSHGRRSSCCQILRRSVRCWLLLAPMLLPGARFELSSGENEIVRRARLLVLSPMDGWAATSCHPRSTKAYFYRNIDGPTRGIGCFTSPPRSLFDQPGINRLVPD